MKKSLIAIAALAAVGAASAQSSVTLYGLADVYFGQNKSTVVGFNTNGVLEKTVTKETGFNSGGLQGSRIGVKGVEDLGNGLKAVFNYEMGFNAIDGALTANGASGEGFGRRAVVGVQGGFGSVLLGRDYTPLFNLLAASSVDGLSSFETVSGAIRTDRTNGIHYAGNFSGVGVQAFAGYNKFDTDANEVVSGVKTADTTDKYQGYGLGVSYANGPLMVGIAGQEFKYTSSDALTSSNGVGKRTEAGVGASYDFGAAKLFANYVNTRVRGTFNGASTGKVKAEEANIGVRVPFGAASVMAGYGHNRVKIHDGAGNLTSKAKGNDWVVGANYAFSKRTDVYARVGRTDDLKWKDAAGVNTGESSKAENVAIGLRHKF